MTEHLLEIFTGLSLPSLTVELERLDSRIQDLQNRREILKEAIGKAIIEECNG